MKNECSLCGGKLRNGICSECGMDNRKSDAMYSHALNQNDCAHKNMSHVHEDGKVKKYQKPVMNKNKGSGEQKSGTAQKQGTQGQTSKYRPSGTFTSTQFTTPRVQKNKEAITRAIITIVVIILFFGAAISISVSQYEESVYTEELSKNLDEFQDYDYSEDYDEDYNPYDGIEDELNPEGEHWEQEIAAGMYKVGVDIPEGEYTLTLREGNTCDVIDSVNNLSAHESFEEGNSDTQTIVGVKLFQGALLCVDGMSPIGFVTENGQVQDMTPRAANPLTQSMDISGQAIAGKDFPAGTYDITAMGDAFGIFRYEIPLNTEDEYSYPLAFSVLMEESPTGEYPGYCSTYKNVVLPEGSMIEAESFTVRLTPSQGVVSEDYPSFYNNMY